MKSKQRGCKEQQNSSSKKGTALISFSFLPVAQIKELQCLQKHFYHHLWTFIPQSKASQEHILLSPVWRTWGKGAWCWFDNQFFFKLSSSDPSEDMDVRPRMTHAAQTQLVDLPLMSQWLALGQDPSACGLQLVCSGGEHPLQSSVPWTPHSPPLLREGHPAHCEWWQQCSEWAEGYVDLPPLRCHV